MIWYLLSKVTLDMSLSNKKKLVSSFFNSQFNYSFFLWIPHSPIINNKISGLHERCFHLLYEDKSSYFQKLLEQDKSVIIHTRNLQILAMEMFEVYRNTSSPILSEIFHRHDKSYDLRINSDFLMQNVRSAFHGSERILYLGPETWNILPLEFKEWTSVVDFKKGFKE